MDVDIKMYQIEEPKKHPYKIILTVDGSEKDCTVFYEHMIDLINMYPNKINKKEFNHDSRLLGTQKSIK